MFSPLSPTVDENAFFRQATLRLCSSLQVEIALERLLEYLRQFLPAQAVCLLLYDPEQNVGRALAAVGEPELLPRSQVTPFPESIWGDFLEMRKRAPETEITNDLDEAEEVIQVAWKLVWGGEREVSAVGMDLELDQERLGHLLILARGKHRFADRHARLVSLLHEPFAVSLANWIQHDEVLRLKDLLSDDNRFLQQQLRRLSGDTIIGADFGLHAAMQLVRQVAPLETPVLLLGETGVGKEVVADALHATSLRKDGPFIKINCGAIPESLIDSELFGHEKGAFTGAAERHRGRFERADGGTIFLDEVGELPPQAQVRLLRVLQNREVERVGGSRPVPVDVRVVSATHRDLETMVSAGRFRQDLWFRLNVFPVRIPPLRDRREDIPALVHFFIEEKCREMKIDRPRGILPGAMERLRAYDWPGNVREVQNAVERELILRQGGELRFEEIGRAGPTAPDDPDAGRVAVETLDDALARAIRAALSAAGGRIEGEGGAAQRLAVHPSTLRAKMRKLDIAFGRKAKAPGRAG